MTTTIGRALWPWVMFFALLAFSWRVAVALHPSAPHSPQARPRVIHAVYRPNPPGCPDPSVCVDL
jgi:hypothetical protein